MNLDDIDALWILRRMKEGYSITIIRTSVSTTIKTAKGDIYVSRDIELNIDDLIELLERKAVSAG